MKNNELIYYRVICPECKDVYILPENNLICPRCSIPLNESFQRFIEQIIFRPFDLNNESECQVLSRLWVKNENGCCYPVSGISRDQILINGSWKTPQYVLTHYKEMIHEMPVGYSSVAKNLRRTSIDKIQDQEEKNVESLLHKE